MIRELCDLNDAFLGKIENYPKYGQSRVRNVDTVLCLSLKGDLTGIVSLVETTQDEKGKIKSSNPFKIVPFQATRTSGIFPYFLCDTPMFILGIDPEKGELSEAKFKASAELHKSVIGSANSVCGKAILSFFEKWKVSEAFDNPIIKGYMGSFRGSIIFRVDGMDALDDDVLWDCWMTHFQSRLAEKQMCTVLGKELPAVTVHPKINGMFDGPSTGSSLVSFNNPVFESYGMSKNANARISDYAAYSYSTALNYMLSDSRFRIGANTFVCWAVSAEPEYHEFFINLLDASAIKSIDQEDIKNMFRRISSGLPVEFNEKKLDSDVDFYILGMVPNNGRLSVSYFTHNTFGKILENIIHHYERLAIICGKAVVGPFRLLNELLLPGGKSSDIPVWLSADFLDSIISNTRYPESVYTKIISRIMADRNVNSIRAAFIKAYLLKNSSDNRKKEVAEVKLNNKSDYQPYVLGRLFAVLENVQRAANGAGTIKDRFFDSACATPSIAFPSVLLLANKHLKTLERKDKPGLARYFEEQIVDIMSLLGKSFPSHLTLEEQGVFIIGYYHQINSIEKKEETDESDR
ncbi:MAG: type I-C CRISPR-associated protein Cas8c/Csd1 [Spirochaetes bacterium]|uniref:Type I-C CRISPR-associated protein Cas8c/Csd1 n=1 Tax=Candidatus Ornithospirochaeta stercoripullorum TaxID=2840899 RepID=A0A9D9DZG5_9SPIO|nr:type I-C CRISPR-associated protein Cas8c/Csd1 [Candidatus Ornithospirochaeta stercoripullorum]